MLLIEISTIRLWIRLWPFRLCRELPNRLLARSASSQGIPTMQTTGRGLLAGVPRTPGSREATRQDVEVEKHRGYCPRTSPAASGWIWQLTD